MLNTAEKPRRESRSALPSFRCPLSAQKRAFWWAMGVLRRAKSFESGRARWCLARYEPGELPGCATPRKHNNTQLRFLSKCPFCKAVVIPGSAVEIYSGRMSGPKTPARRLASRMVGGACDASKGLAVPSRCKLPVSHHARQGRPCWTKLTIHPCQRTRSRSAGTIKTEKDLLISSDRRTLRRGDTRFCHPESCRRRAS
jgi:hypothetical protein